MKVKKDVEFSFEEGTTIDTKGATLVNVKIDGGFSGFINPQSGNTIVVQNGIIVSG